jgi:hypothetical protein
VAKHPSPEFANKLDPVAKRALKDLRKFVADHYGKRCPTRAHGCYCCQMWAQYDCFELLVHK